MPESEKSNMPALPALMSHSRNIYSQFGEDGIIEEILARLPADKWCVEFGAWDGIHLSNTYNLIKNHGYRAVLIEGNRLKFEELCRNIPNPEIEKICAFVTFDGAQTLDRILAGTPIPKNFDFLSIDIDGNDYHILESLEQFRPKVICIEFNPSIPNEVEFVQAKDFSVNQGSSACSMLLLARAKGYALVLSTEANLILVERGYLASLGMEVEPTLEDCRDDSKVRVFLFSGFDGTVFTSAPMTLHWNGLRIAHRSWQQLPKFLRKFPDNYTVLEKIAFKIFRVLKYPERGLQKIFGPRRHGN